MNAGYFYGGLFCILYMLGVGYFGGIKKTPWLIKIVKLKLGKNMTDETAAKICLYFGGIVGAVGIFLFIRGASIV